jgi:hypothetical protein
MVKFVIESIKANMLSEDMMKMVSNPRRIHLSHLREDEVIKSEYEHTYSKSRRMVVILL